MKKFCSSLREHATDIINFESKKMLTLTEKELKLHKGATACYICGKRLLKKFAKDKIIKKLETIAILQVNTEVQHIVYVI